MSRNVLSKLSYANVTATLALIVALGGTSYAAVTLPRNSVGSRQIRTGAVHSREVKNRSLQTADLSLTARRSLRGATGPAGPSGPTGPAGAPAFRYFAVVRANGEFARGNATSGGSAGSTGNYVVGFDRSTSDCAYTATLGTPDASTVGPGHVAVHDATGRVAVQTFDAAGNAADLPFHLLVAC